MLCVARYWSQRGLGPLLALQIPIILTMKSSYQSYNSEDMLSSSKKLESLHKLRLSWWCTTQATSVKVVLKLYLCRFGGRLNNFYAKLQLTLWLWQQFWDHGCQQIIKWAGGNGLEGAAAAIHNNHHTPSPHHHIPLPGRRK